MLNFPSENDAKDDSKFFAHDTSKCLIIPLEMLKKFYQNLRKYYLIRFKDFISKLDDSNSFNPLELKKL